MQAQFLPSAERITSIFGLDSGSIRTLPFPLSSQCSILRYCQWCEHSQILTLDILGNGQWTSRERMIYALLESLGLRGLDYNSCDKFFNNNSNKKTPVGADPVRMHLVRFGCLFADLFIEFHCPARAGVSKGYCTTIYQFRQALWYNSLTCTKFLPSNHSILLC